MIQVSENLTPDEFLCLVSQLGWRILCNQTMDEGKRKLIEGIRESAYTGTWVQFGDLKHGEYFDHGQGDSLIQQKLVGNQIKFMGRHSMKGFEDQTTLVRRFLKMEEIMRPEYSNSIRPMTRHQYIMEQEAKKDRIYDEEHEDDDSDYDGDADAHALALLEEKFESKHTRLGMMQWFAGYALGCVSMEEGSAKGIAARAWSIAEECMNQYDERYRVVEESIKRDMEESGLFPDNEQED